MGRYVVGISGASGAPYVRRVLQVLASSGHRLDLVVTGSGAKVLEVEEGVSIAGESGSNIDELSRWIGRDMSSRSGFNWHHEANVAADIASGSCHVDGMVVAPCSGGTLARIANGMSGNLLERAADVTLKERRRLILMTRETPLSLVHLRNMVAVTEAGAIVLPASPGFYHKP
ncbi:MAG: UbiX family flavin prenyltransferase, partial [Chloroflexi bacterium]|nr:UbiX family flavin prenyltransferase [Chloroflexota bacterium]